MGMLLRCVDCSQERFWPDDTFDDQPIEAWWKSKGERCSSCRRRAERRPTNTEVARSDEAARRRVVRLLDAAGEDGATFADLCRALPWSSGEVSERLAELADSGRVDSGERSCASGADVVWRVINREGVTG